MAGVSVHGRGHVWQGVCMAGGMHGRGVCMRGRRDGHCSGRYASYWNAFLFNVFPLYKCDCDTTGQWVLYSLCFSGIPFCKQYI